MKSIYLFLLSALCVQITYGQTFKRWPNGRVEMVSKELSFTQKPNIFNDFKWTYPSIKSIPVVFKDGNAAFDFAGKHFQATLVSDKSMRLSEVNGANVESSEQLSEGNMYYDKSSLRYKAVTVSSWTPYTTYTQQSVPVTRTRSVAVYSSSNGKPTTSYRNESYTVYEYRSVARTDYRYTPHTTYVLDIPQYPYYSFKMNDSVAFVVYKTGSKYYVQNASYIIATDLDNVNHIFIDANSNGDFFDDADKVMFNSWDPYSKTSSYRPAGMFRDNNWYDLPFLRTNNFLTFSKSAVTGKLKIDYENSSFSDDEEKGKVTIENVPDDADLMVNGKMYRAKKGTKTYKTQYGKFFVRISKDGYMDFEANYYVDATNPVTSITYQSPKEAGLVQMQNIFQKSYFVTVSDSNGYNQTHNNAARFKVPLGAATVAIYSDGFTLTKQFHLAAGEKATIDFEAEIKKLQDEEQKNKPTDTEQKK
jgi:hypothetical protein